MIENHTRSSKEVCLDSQNARSVRYKNCCPNFGNGNSDAEDESRALEHWWTAMWGIRVLQMRFLWFCNESYVHLQPIQMYCSHTGTPQTNLFVYTSLSTHYTLEGFK